MERNAMHNLSDAIAREDWRTESEKLHDLTDAWKAAKRNEQEAAAARIAIESEIYEITHVRLPDKGTFALDSGMRIATGFTEDWDQGALNKAHQEWPASVPFPFIGVWKPDGKAITYLRENMPDLYRLIQGALTLKPKKPAFSVKEV